MSGAQRELFGFHRPGDSPVHRAPLGAKAAVMVVLSVLLVLPVPQLLAAAGVDRVLGLPVAAAAWLVPGILLLIVLGIGAAAGLRARSWWEGTRPALWILAFLGAYHLVLGRPATAAEVILTVLCALLATRVLLETTPLPELLDGLVRVLGPLRRVGADPERVGLAVQIMLRTIPFLSGAVDGIREACAARGLRMTPLRVATPVVIAAVAHGQRTGEALAARGLDSPAPSAPAPTESAGRPGRRRRR